MDFYKFFPLIGQLLGRRGHPSFIRREWIIFLEESHSTMKDFVKCDAVKK